MHVKSFLKNHKKGLIITIILIILYVLLFEIDFFFTPMHNKPDTIEVYKYGQKYEFHDGDREFNDIYRLLHRYSKGTMNTILQGGMSASNKWGYPNLPREYSNDGMVIRVIYNDIQQDSRTGGYNVPYNVLVFLLNNSNHNYNKDVNGSGYSVPYTTFEKIDGFAKTNDPDGAYFSVIINFHYPQKVEEYVAKNIP